MYASLGLYMAHNMWNPVGHMARVKHTAGELHLFLKEELELATFAFKPYLFKNDGDPDTEELVNRVSE